MSLKNYSNQELLQGLEKLARAERKITHLILVHINEIEERKLHLDLGYDGIYSYLTKGLGFSDGAAYRRLQSARLLKQVPDVAKKIEEGQLHLSQLTAVQKCIKEAAKVGTQISATQTKNILRNLENKNTIQTQKTLAIEFNLPRKEHQKLTLQKDDSVRLEITLTAEQFAELEISKDLLSHVCVDGQWSDVIAKLAEKFNRQKMGGRSLRLVP